MSFIIPGPKTEAGLASRTTDPTPSTSHPTLEAEPDVGDDFGDLLDEELSNPFRSPQAAPEPEPHTPTKAKSSGSTKKQRETLANGIKFVFYGTVATVLGSICGFVALFVMPPLALVGLGTMVIGAIVSTIGRIICLGGPENVGGKGLLFAAVACDLISIGIGILVGAGAIDEQLDRFSSLLGMATWILFVLFLKGVATSIGQPHLVENARTIIIFVVIAIVLWVATIALAIVFPLLTLLTALGMLGFMLGALINYLNLLQHTAEAVRP